MSALEVNVDKKPSSQEEIAAIITSLKERLAKSEPLRSSTKLRYILEVLERVGRPAEFTSEWDWQFNVSRAQKWRTFGSNKDKNIKNHPWVDQFLDSVEDCCTTFPKQQERQEMIEVILDACDEKINVFLYGGYEGLSASQTRSFEIALKCLKALEPEVLSFYHQAQLE